MCTHHETRLIYRGSITSEHGGMLLRASACTCRKCDHLHPDTRQHVVATLDTGVTLVHARRTSFYAETVTLDEWGERPQLSPEQAASRLLTA